MFNNGCEISKKKRPKKSTENNENGVNFSLLSVAEWNRQLEALIKGALKKNDQKSIENNINFARTNAFYAKTIYRFDSWKPDARKAEGPSGETPR